MLRVLHLSSEMSWRGGEQQIAYLIEELEKKGIENFVVCKKRSAFEQYCRDNEINFLSVPFVNQYDLFSAWEVKKFCQEFNIDLVHAHSGYSHGLSVLSAILGNKSPIILSRRVDFPIKRNFISQLKYNHPSVRKIICVSHTIEQIVRKSVKKPERCITIHSGINLERFHGKVSSGLLRKEFNIPDHKVLIGNISALAPHKDYYTFVDTAELLIKKGLEAIYLIIGDGPERENIENYIEKKGLTQHIILTGFRQDIPSVLPELDIFLITSKTEGLGTTVLDAFACKVPVIATAGGGLKELVKHETTGLLTEVGNPEMLSEQVIKLVKDKDLYNLLAKNAFDKVQEFSREHTAEKTLEVYKNLVKKKSRFK